MDHHKLKELATFYRHHLLQENLPFWESRTEDKTHGGYLVSFDREGKLTATDKNLWCQGRQTYMFSVLYNQVEPRENWLKLAQCGRPTSAVPCVVEYASEYSSTCQCLAKGERLAPSRGR